MTISAMSFVTYDTKDAIITLSKFYRRYGGSEATVRHENLSRIQAIAIELLRRALDINKER